MSNVLSFGLQCVVSRNECRKMAAWTLMFAPMCRGCVSGLDLQSKLELRLELWSLELPATPASTPQ